MKGPLSGRDRVIFKGTRDGIAIVIDEGVAFAEVVSQLREKIVAARDFFAGARVHVQLRGRELASEEREALAEAVKELGMTLAEQGEAARSRPGRPQARPEAQHTLLIRRTLRSGQRIDYDGNVVVMGDVNAGAVITCTGDIVVLGTLRGVAHAGAAGNTQACVLAFRLEPTQLRIAHYISRAPDGETPRPVGPEIAAVRDDVIQIEGYVP
ncbi:MAG TPA: septum site-determining protein MinC [Limnochordia bacterium]